MNKITQLHWCFWMLICLVSCNAQNHEDQSENKIAPSQNPTGWLPTTAKVDTLVRSNAPNIITRSMIEDKRGNIWFATFGGVIKYDGSSFTNMTKEVSKSRFFSVLEDRKGDLWFGSIGGGIFRYDGQSFQHFTTDDGLVNNEIGCMYEDKAGNIWFGANGGVSVYDGQYFRNYMMDGDMIKEAEAGKFYPNMQRPSNEITSIVEDESGNFWLSTRGDTYLYDGTSFNKIKHKEAVFINIRSIIKDRAGNIWLGGNNGLWRFDGADYTHITKDFIGYIYEDKEGNIWTSSNGAYGWTLSRYDRASLEDAHPSATPIKTGEGMFFGIVEDSNGHIWAGTLGGVYRYDGEVMARFVREN